MVKIGTIWLLRSFYQISVVRVWEPKVERKQHDEGVVQVKPLCF
jgi:hypothetical protein